MMIITNIFLSPHYVPGTVRSNLCVSSLLLKRPDEVGTVIFLFLQPTRRPRDGVTRSEAIYSDSERRASPQTVWAIAEGEYGLEIWDG